MVKEKSKKGHIDKRGYIVLYNSIHPNKWKNDHIHEHVLIMSEYLGRPLKKGENIHHINGDRQDNRVENLELWHRTQPSGQKLTDKIKSSLELLRSYGYQIREINHVI